MLSGKLSSQLVSQIGSGDCCSANLRMEHAPLTVLNDRLGQHTVSIWLNFDANPS